ncbi:ribosome biogenesis protein slx9 [Candidozyma auris]|uniref:Ribosome biogenesis protein SLX9 n=1 Tax=Candidozyma auris TaxID=498019 RepID=A0A2H1A2E6_CANAR|nr:hypothetical_protein [[Candida] auris]PIS57044.1 hypothetical protein CJI97_000067 [[Candida] auris]PIS58615.1 hypothetical protein B9J08_000061 [[Candida] auris]QEO20683.1 hypothetical_protein [[Candida] auris]
MSIKKKTGLRSKSAKRASIASKIAEFKQEQASREEHHENPLLKLSQTSKKEKLKNKSQDFNEKILSKVSFNLSGGISKSASRRRKRKSKENLKPKMDDLLSSLPEETLNLVEAKTPQAFIAAKKKEANKPNPQKQGGHAKLLQTENRHFNRVLTDKQFKASPFAALKSAIQHNLQQS